MSEEVNISKWRLKRISQKPGNTDGANVWKADLYSILWLLIYKQTYSTLWKETVLQKKFILQVDYFSYMYFVA
jgi:hypothetical protein